MLFHEITTVLLLCVSFFVYISAVLKSLSMGLYLYYYMYILDDFEACFTFFERAVVLSTKPT